MALVSIVIPVFDNSLSLKALAQRLDQLAAEHPRHDFEFIYVDDGSGEDSFATLQSLAEVDRRVRVIKLTRSFGATAAVMAGITYALGDCVGIIAADLQDPPETFSEMIHRWEAGYKLVIAIQKSRLDDPWSRRLLAMLFYWLSKKLVIEGIPPQEMGFFLIDRQVADLLVQSNGKTTLLPNFLFWTGYKPSLVEYDREPRQQESSRWTFSIKLRYLTDALVAYSRLPLRVCSFFGIGLTLCGLIYALVILIASWVNSISLPSWSALAALILITSGAQLVALGVSSEYLWRTFDTARNRAMFVVETTINAPLATQALGDKTERLLVSLSNVGARLRSQTANHSERSLGSVKPED
jgi:dolichol-phosphate mannosyltransferase